MGTHKDWFKPICFKLKGTKEYQLHHGMNEAMYVTYGLINWPNRCQWIVPGTINPED